MILSCITEHFSIFFFFLSWFLYFLAFFFPFLLKIFSFYLRLLVVAFYLLTGALRCWHLLLEFSLEKSYVYCLATFFLFFFYFAGDCSVDVVSLLCVSNGYGFIVFYVSNSYQIRDTYLLSDRNSFMGAFKPSLKQIILWIHAISRCWKSYRASALRPLGLQLRKLRLLAFSL